MKLENTKLYESAQLGVSSDSGLTSLLVRNRDRDRFAVSQKHRVRHADRRLEHHQSLLKGLAR